MNQDWISFWVGLIDGDGSIQVNHWKRKYLQYRVVLKLKYTEHNAEMLKFLSKELKVGSVRIDVKNQFVVWVENDKAQVIKLIQIFDKYPPLSSRMRCQVSFVKQSMENYKDTINWYFENRDLKYQLQNEIIREMSLKKITKLSYFPSWLSGFIEAESCFCIKNINHNRNPIIFSFSISQKNDEYILRGIKSYLNATNKVRLIKNNVYLLEIYKLTTLLSLEKHLKDFPLRGEKKRSAEVFYSNMETSKRYFLN